MEKTTEHDQYLYKKDKNFVTKDLTNGITNYFFKRNSRLTEKKQCRIEFFTLQRIYSQEGNLIYIKFLTHSYIHTSSTSCRTYIIIKIKKKIFCLSLYFPTFLVKLSDFASLPTLFYFISFRFIRFSLFVISTSNVIYSRSKPIYIYMLFLYHRTYHHLLLLSHIYFLLTDFLVHLTFLFPPYFPSTYFLPVLF